MGDEIKFSSDDLRIKAGNGTMDCSGERRLGDLAHYTVRVPDLKRMDEYDRH